MRRTAGDLDIDAKGDCEEIESAELSVQAELDLIAICAGNGD